MPADDNSWAAVSVSSAKGFGPLASTSQRLLTKLAYTGPGPGSYLPQGPSSSKHARGNAGSSPFSTTGRALTAAARTASASSQGLSPGPGAHELPQVAYTGTHLAWVMQHKLGAAAAAFKTAPRGSSASAEHLREQLQQCKYSGGQSVPWLLSPPTHTGGRPLPGRRLVQSAQPRRGVAQATHQQQPQHIAATRFGLAAHSTAQPPFIQQPLSAPGGVSRGSKFQAVDGRSSWQVAAPDSTAAPGPGSYDLLKYGALKPSAPTHRSAFIKPLVMDRFGAPVHRAHAAQHVQQQQQPEQPQGKQCRSSTRCGCQAAHGAAGHRHQSCCTPSSRQPGVSAGFRSQSPGHAEAFLAAADAGMVGAPGPTYYSPKQLPHRVSYRHSRQAHNFVGTV